MGKGPKQPKDPAPAAPPVAAGDPSTAASGAAQAIAKKKKRKGGIASTILADRAPTAGKVARVAAGMSVLG